LQHRNLETGSWDLCERACSTVVEHSNVASMMPRGLRKTTQNQRIGGPCQEPCIESLGRTDSFNLASSDASRTCPCPKNSEDISGQVRDGQPRRSARPVSHGPSNSALFCPHCDTGSTGTLATATFADPAGTSFGHIFNGDIFCIASGVLCRTMTRSCPFSRRRQTRAKKGCTIRGRLVNHAWG